MALVIRIHETGGPDVLTAEQIQVPQPGNNEILIRQQAIGINYIDIYHRTGLYKLLGYPVGLGLEGAGIIEQLGDNVSGLNVGDRIAYCGGPIGAYAEYRTLPAKYAVKLPEGVSEATAAAGMLKGLTAYYLLYSTFQARKGDTILWHAAAGGVGLIACQMAKKLGVTMIGTVGSKEKAELARENGCEHVILYRDVDFVSEVKRITGGKGVDVVYDSVGRTTFSASLDCLKPFGMMVSFGQSSGAIDPIDPAILSQKGSLYLTRPSLMHHIEDTANYQRMAAAWLDMVAKKDVSVRIGGMYHLDEVKQAHRELESRNTTGSLILTV